MMLVIATEAIGMTGIADPERLTIIAILLAFLAGFKTRSWVMGWQFELERQRADKYEAIALRLVDVAEKMLHRQPEDASTRRVS